MPLLSLKSVVAGEERNRMIKYTPEHMFAPAPRPLPGGRGGAQCLFFFFLDRRGVWFCQSVCVQGDGEPITRVFLCFAVRGASRSRDERATGDAHLREGLDGDVVSSRLRGGFRGAV